MYKKDFRRAEVFAAPSVPNIRSNDSTIQVGGVILPMCVMLVCDILADQDERFQICDNGV